MSQMSPKKSLKLQINCYNWRHRFRRGPCKLCHFQGSAVRGIVRACSSLGWPLGCRASAVYFQTVGAFWFWV